MTTGHVFIATSLDGFVARQDHSLDWLMKQNIEGEDHGFEAFMDSVDGMVMGAGSFRTVLGFGEWPYRKPVVVLSNSLTSDDVPEHLKGKVRLSGLGPKEIMEELDREGWKRVYVDGGKLVQSFLREGVIFDLAVTLVPILIGEGLPLFALLEADVDLELISAETFNSGMLKTFYRLK